MLKSIFQILGIVGFIIICILAFVVPSNPYEIIPALTVMSFDKPLWLCIIVGDGFLYLIVLYALYNRIIEKL